MNHEDKLPDNRRKVLLETVAEYFDCDVSKVNKVHIEIAAQVDPKYVTNQYTRMCAYTPHIRDHTSHKHTYTLRERNTSYVAHAEIVVKSLVEKDQVFEFQRRWRQHFLDTMKPRFLPDLWCVDHNPS